MLQARATFSRAWSPGWHWPQNVCLDLSQIVTDATASTICLVKLIANLSRPPILTFRDLVLHDVGVSFCS